MLIAKNKEETKMNEKHIWVKDKSNGFFDRLIKNIWKLPKDKYAECCKLGVENSCAWYKVKK